jgi:hypothetical protein
MSKPNFARYRPHDPDACYRRSGRRSRSASSPTPRNGCSPPRAATACSGRAHCRSVNPPNRRQECPRRSRQRSRRAKPAPQAGSSARAAQARSECVGLCRMAPRARRATRARIDRVAPGTRVRDAASARRRDSAANGKWYVQLAALSPANRAHDALAKRAGARVRKAGGIALSCSASDPIATRRSRPNEALTAHQGEGLSGDARILSGG